MSRHLNRAWFAVVLGSPSLALAQKAPEALPAGGALGAIAGLGIVVALILGIGWVMRRVGGVSGLQRGPLRVLGATSVGQRERVVLVRYQDSILILGVAAGHIALLKETSAPPDPSGDLAAEAPSFLARLRAAGGVGRNG